MSRVGAHLGSDTAHVRMGCRWLCGYIERAWIRRQVVRDVLLPARAESVDAGIFAGRGGALHLFQFLYFLDVRFYGFPRWMARRSLGVAAETRKTLATRS